MTTMVTPLNNQEVVTQYNNESSTQEITRVTLSSIHKVEGNKELDVTPVIPIMHTDYRLTVENVNSSKVFDVPTIPTHNLEKNSNHDISQEVLNNPNGNEYKCPKCNRLFSRKFNMQSHLATHDSERIRPFTCEYPSCGLSFTRKHDLKRHIIGVHEDQKEFGCPYCDKTFARKDAFKRHTLKCALNDSDKTDDDDNGEGSSSNPLKNKIHTRTVSHGITRRTYESTEIGENRVHTRSVSRGIMKRIIDEDSDDSTDEGLAYVTTSRRGRPPKRQLDSPDNDESNSNTTEIKAKRGRPRKIVSPEEESKKESAIPRKRGRPRKDPQDKPVENTVKTGKRGRPRKIIDPDEQKPVSTNGRGRPRKIPKIDEELTSTPIISRGRGRPRREPEDNTDENSNGIKITTNKRGRPRKTPKIEDIQRDPNEPIIVRKRGRPRKDPQSDEKLIKIKSNKRGRPRKNQVNESESQSLIFNNDDSDGAEIDELIDELI
ncbi:hypothetical protein Glove_296g19 [Diversispora epigaea]|uniref:C2H2-type domain-containing protein n=1 Tax=Diversispora epigaea TaxID=1348612 RepID=A0A397I1Z1_9GLOM|nr:hypothetical protein Glove_296g19 [Diversispora epigaea]